MKNSTDFNITLEAFPGFAHEKINFLQRDMREFARYGHTMEKAATLDARVRNFEDLPTDEEYVGDVMIATEKKNAMAKELLQKIRALMLYVQNKFGLRTAYYNKFGASTLSQLTNEMLLSTGRRVARVAMMYREELRETGMSTAHIEELKAMATEFYDAMEAQSDALADREIGTMLRIHMANELYLEISRICETGKGIWKDLNAAKYKAYIIYGASKPRKETPGTEREPSAQPPHNQD